LNNWIIKTLVESDHFLDNFVVRHLVEL